MMMWHYVTLKARVWITGSEVIEVFARPLIHALMMLRDTIITRMYTNSMLTHSNDDFTGIVTSLLFDTQGMGTDHRFRGYWGLCQTSDPRTHVALGHHNHSYECLPFSMLTHSNDDDFTGIVTSSLVDTRGMGTDHRFRGYWSLCQTSDPRTHDALGQHKYEYECPPFECLLIAVMMM